MSERESRFDLNVHQPIKKHRVSLELAKPQLMHTHAHTPTILARKQTHTHTETEYNEINIL